ncbi:MAG: DUF721 domain-containing protein [Bdellovibrionales bacterium]|nr:DUF721 domain-containing protein [Bdellovibrionales bacterium]
MAVSEGPQKLNGLLGSFKFIQWVRAWRKCAGPALRQQTRFMGLRWHGGKMCLHLEVADPVWRQELEYQKKDLLATFRKCLAEEKVPESEWPQDCLLAAGATVPFKARNP